MVKQKNKHGIPDSRFQIPTLGMSLIEILVVITIFAVMGVVVARAVILTVGGSKKSESIVKVRENLNYAMGIVERQIRNANSIPTCPNSDSKVIDYIDQYGKATSFSCGADYVASGSARLTNNEIIVSGCSFICSPGANYPDSIKVSFTAKDKYAVGIQNATVSVESQISLRNY